ncbi:nose resistant to fluoxetine protein 6 [Octopus bimaculoides]|nr:nose resistant to fluoxetine protein 6 [Octopus bimaculoides]
MKANGGKMNWVYFYIHRFWRLTPPYMLLMMLYVPLFRYMGHGPFWPPQGIEKDFCKNSWYYNLFYINNFMPNASKNMCMGWSWYLANDMQFYWISPLIIIPLYKSAKLGHLVALLLLVAHFAVTAVIATLNHSSITLVSQDNNDDFDQIYIKPYTRIGPYLIGMLYGYHLYTDKTKKLLNGYISCVLWSMATISAVAVLYGVYNIQNGAVVSQAVSVFYITVHRTVWGLCLGWVIYACYTGYGGFVNTILSWKALIPLSRLTYTAYLIHPIVLFFYFLSQMYPTYATQINIVSITMATTRTLSLCAYVSECV